MNMCAVRPLRWDVAEIGTGARVCSTSDQIRYLSPQRPRLSTGEHRNAQNPQLSSRYVTGLFGASQAEKLSEAAGLCDDRGRLPSSFSIAALWQLCLDNINLTDDEGQGCTKQFLPKSTWGVIFAAINQMETVGEGIRRFAELAQMVPAGIDVTVGYGDSGLHLNLNASEIPADTERMERYIEVIALAFHCALLWITAERISPVQVRLSSLLDDRDGSMLSYFTTKSSRHGSGVTIVYDRSDVSLPLGVRKYKYWANETAGFLEFAARFPSETSPLASPMAEKVRRLLTANDLSQPEAARAVAMSVATFQRHLRKEGITFRELSKQVLREKLISLLATDGNLDDVAVELGFSERRSLWRACHDLLGVSPTQYRKCQRTAFNADART
ncbi:Transcriptional regulator, AraC family [Caballeronia sordidicola]|uniref:Transcriptional regulator, AraC family n=2 Tax=Caballeronia sordidicola TaxID=196367 RepID=A0A242N625_CABSO|nr:Transcriptional regulator, AraC family [Caballeronia sordidicola]